MSSGLNSGGLNFSNSHLIRAGQAEFDLASDWLTKNKKECRALLFVFEDLCGVNRIHRQKLVTIFVKRLLFRKRNDSRTAHRNKYPPVKRRDIYSTEISFLLKLPDISASCDEIIFFLTASALKPDRIVTKSYHSLVDDPPLAARAGVFNVQCWMICSLGVTILLQQNLCVSVVHIGLLFKTYSAIIIYATLMQGADTGS